MNDYNLAHLPDQIELLPNVIQIPLTKGYSAVVDEIDADLADFKWHALENKLHVYASRCKMTNGKRKTVLMHRFVYERIIGRPLLRNEWVDHENQYSLDCRRTNLRLSSPSQNCANSLKKHKSDMPKGAYRVPHTKKIRAAIKVNLKTIHIGYFDTPELAHAAYMEAARRHFGEFANDGTSK